MSPCLASAASCGLALPRRSHPAVPCRPLPDRRAASRGALQVVANSRERRPFARPQPSHNGNSGLPASLFMPITGELPEEGQFLTEAEASCNEMEKFCGDPYYVYESDCRPCFGTGSVRSAMGGRARARQVLVECPHCNGLGVVRRVTTRFFPLDSEDEHVQTLARKEEYRTHLNGRGGSEQPRGAKPKPKSNPTLVRKPPSYYKSRRKSKQQGSNGATRPANGADTAPPEPPGAAQQAATR